MKRLVIGIGNEYRRDDAVGRLVARQVRRTLGAGVEVREACGEGTELIDLWAGADQVVVVDAAHSLDSPGRICRFDCKAAPLPATFGTGSSHDFSLPQAVEMARVLGCLPPRLVVLGIVGGDFSNGEALTPAVDAAIPQAVLRVVGELQPQRMGGAACTKHPC